MNMIDVLQRMAYDTKTKLLGKVDKVDGKALSSNDFSNAYKTKLDGIADGATANVGTITGIKMNGESKGTSGNVDLGTIITEHQDITGKQNKIDNSLTTTSKEIVGAINEVNSNLSAAETTLNAKIIDHTAPRCILTDNEGTVTSNYGFTYDILSQLLSTNTWRGKIKNKDYIRLICKNGDAFDMEFNIDTYYNYGDTAVSHHIDMISRHLIPNSVEWQMRTDNTNNGTESIPNPFLASTNMIDKLNAYFSNIPNELAGHIVEKRILMSTRYSSASSTLTNDNNWYWGNLPKLWLPFEGEVASRCHWSSVNWQGGHRQYPCFTDGTSVCKNNGESGGRATWWLGSAASGNSTSFCDVTNDGTFDSHYASHAWLGVPLCFRFI